jgi:hypothetical protein
MGISYVEKLRGLLDQVPQFRGPIEDFSLIARHEDLVKGLAYLVLPPTFW